MVHIYTGDGKGKTTAAVGLALRAASAGKKVLFFQFLKSDTSGERCVLCGIENITVINIGREIPFLFNADEKTKSQIRELYKEKLEMIFSISGLYSVFVFDEAVSAIDAGVIDPCDVLRFSDFGELILTGRGDISELEDRADYITNMTKLKHPFDRGVKAREGIEY